MIILSKKHIISLHGSLIKQSGGASMVLKFGEYEIDVDIQKTRSFYENAKFISEECSCDGCQNFEKAVDVLPQSVKVFFSDLGINMKKICECYVNVVNEDESLLYGGFCHICGTLLSGNGAWVKIDKNTAYWKKDSTFSVSQNFHISFQDNISLLEKDFPLPVIQLEISANIPWVLEKENPYLYSR